MSTYIETCRCNGRQPSGVVGKKRVSRPEAVGLLLKDRSVPRFLVAPNGYGKTHVAFEYASIVFAFKHVLWFRCESPCFVRDLDAGILREGIDAADSDSALVVFDDVPIMDQRRVDALSDVIDGLLHDGREVIVICCPSADAYAPTQKDRILLTSRELLLDEAEVAALGLLDAAHGDIPCVAWGADGSKRLLGGCSKEAMPADLKCAMLRLMVLGSGVLSEALGIFDEGRSHEICQMLMRYYTFLGVRMEDGRFSALDMEISDIKAVFLGSLDEVYGCTPFASADKLGVDLVDALVASSRLERAFDVVEAYVSHAEALQWLDHRGWAVICRGYPLMVIKLMMGASKRRKLTPERLLLLAWASWAVGSAKEASLYCRRACASAACGPRVHAGACGLQAHLAPEALDADATFAFAESLARLEAEAKHGQRDSGGQLDWLVLGQIMLPVSLGDAIDEAAWDKLANALVEDVDRAPSFMKLSSALIGIAWTVESLNAAKGGLGSHEDDARTSTDALLGAFGAFVQRCMEICLDDDDACRALSFALSVTEATFERCGAPVKHRLPSAPAQVSVHMAQTRLSIERQAQEVAKRTEETAQAQAKFERTHPDPYRRSHASPVMVMSSVPQLEVRMFGGLEMRIDGETLDPNLFSRKRTRTLAAALALNKGHELTRERICEIVWPGSDPDMCVNSFYSIWASLKRALTFEGSCPYLVRSQVGCSFDPRYLATDMEEFEALCNSLVFGGAQMTSWEDLYAKVSGTFADSLLPNEADNPYISEIRERCKSRLVDGLLAVSRRLIGLDERTGALWFAREALRWDEAREDVYISLMEAQIAANQRGPALDTYFKCRKFLSEGLGIDPSPRLVQLYRSIIEYEEEI